MPTQVEQDVDQTTIAASSVAGFAAVILLSVLFSTSDATTGARIILLASFTVLVVVTGLAVSLLLERLQDTTAEIRVRAAVVLLVAFVALAERFGLESILGAFLAGAVVAMVDRDTASHPHFRTKLQAIGYGFLIPVFFITGGMRLDLRGLFDRPAALLTVPLFLLALLIIRGVPALFYRPLLGARLTLAAGLPPGHLAAVHCGRNPDRRTHRPSDPGHRRRAHLRWTAFSPPVPSGCPGA
jgi:Kef-type K+ transport system membrane component KefB